MGTRIARLLESQPIFCTQLLEAWADTTQDMSEFNEPENDRQRSLRALRPRPSRDTELGDAAASFHDPHDSDAVANTFTQVESRVSASRAANRGMDAQQVTRTDPGRDERMVPDGVIRLRQWGTRAYHELPATTSGREWTIGAAAPCWLQLSDPRRLVSRKHARLVRDGSRWLIRDLDSKNGVRVDGVRRTEVVLEPGLEIGIGGITLVAESARLVVLRAFLERILGWADDRLEALDHALRSLRVAATHRAPLVVCGEDDLVQIARGLHGRTLGASRPFVVCDPRRHTTSENVRSAENYDAGMAAMQAAAGGTLCVWARRLPRDFEEVQRALREPSVRIQLVVCAREPSEAGTFVSSPITVPPLATRAGDLRRIIDEYAGDAIAQLGMQPNAFPSSDRDWVLEHAAHSLPEIEKATRRLLAIRETGNLNQAAARLGMARVSLKAWIGRRPLPVPVDD